MAALLFVIVILIVFVGGGYLLGGMAGEFLSWFFKDKDKK